MTITYNALPAEYKAIKETAQPFIVLKTKREPTTADKLLIYEVSVPYAIVKDGERIISPGAPSQHTGNELPIMAVTCVITDGLMKDHYAIGFNLPDMNAPVFRNASQHGEQC